jgi:hypothetical protein
MDLHKNAENSNTSEVAAAAKKPGFSPADWQLGQFRDALTVKLAAAAVYVANDQPVPLELVSGLVAAIGDAGAIAAVHEYAAARGDVPVGSVLS